MKFIVLSFLILQACAMPIVYTTTWCGFCNDQKTYLKARGVSYREVNIEKDKQAWTELKINALMKGYGDLPGVPITDINGDLVIGFDVERTYELLKKWGYIK